MIAVHRLPQSSIAALPEYRDHEAVFELEDPDSSLHGFIAIHKKNAGIPSLGATRLWHYQNSTEALRDALRLSHLMTHKASGAGMLYGGAKCALIMPTEGILDRKKLFAAYASCVNTLQGVFVTGTDVGLTDDDLTIMAKHSSYIIGCGVDSGYYTALGLLYGIQAIFDFLDGTTSVRDKRFAIQGLGKTGMRLLELLLDHGANQIIVSDINEEVVKRACLLSPLIRVADPSEIHKQEVDVFCPCALGGILNKNSISELRCRAIIGSANNQLQSEEDRVSISSQGILYVPDYIANAGGLLSVVDQYEQKSHSHGRLVIRLLTMQERIIEMLHGRREREHQPFSVGRSIVYV